jgi:hypothetical protein
VRRFHHVYCQNHIASGRIGVTSEHCTNEFSNYRILTPPLRAFPVPHGDFFRPANYPFLTPQKQDSEIRIPLSEF